jgi:hypothetical protein
MHLFPSLSFAHNCLGEFLVVFAPTSDKVIVDFLPEKVAINDWLVYFLQNLFVGMVTFCDEVQISLNATCSLEWCNFRVEVGLEEKGDGYTIV